MTTPPRALPSQLIELRERVISPDLIVETDYSPERRYSVSQAETYALCPAKWGWHKIAGIKRVSWDWATASAAVKPANKPENKEALKRYNRLFRPALGVEIHARAQAYYQGESVSFTDRPGQILLVGQRILPHPEQCVSVEAEGEVRMSLTGPSGRAHDFIGYLDLVVELAQPWAGFMAGSRLLIDHKTTYTFDFFDRARTQRTVKSE